MPWRRRTASEENRNFSAEDDYALKRTVLQSMEAVDAFVLVTRDSDFAPTIEMIHHAGRLVLIAAYERRGHRLSRLLRQRADEVLPLREIALDKDDPELLEESESEDAEPAGSQMHDAGIDLFHRARRLLRFPLHDVVEVGRRSVSLAHFPHVDVTDYDPGRTVSRRHLCLRQASERCYVVQVHSTCSGSTWLNEYAVLPGESVVLMPGDRIVFGAREGGFGLRLCLPEHGNPDVF